MDTSKKFAPVLIHPTVYEIWKKRRELPEGIIAQIDSYNTENSLMSNERLVSVTPINFTITLIGEPPKRYTVTLH